MKKTIHKMLNFKVLIAVLLLILFLAFKFLVDGIYIKEFSVYDIGFRGLYLKLGNKWILKLDVLDLREFLAQKHEGSKLGLDDSIRIFKDVLRGLSYFEVFEIKEIKLKDFDAYIGYKDGRFKFDFPYASADFLLAANGEFLRLDLSRLIIHQPHVKSSGIALYSTKDKYLVFDLTLAVKKSTLNLAGKASLDEITFFAKSSNIYDISYIFPYLKRLKNKAAYEWLAIRSRFSYARLNYLGFKARFANFKEDLINSLQGKITIKDANVMFQPGLSHILAPRVDLVLKDNTLHFDITRPTYETWKLDGSKLKIEDLIARKKGGHPTIVVSLKSKNASADARLQKILASYHIPLPIREAPLSKDSYNYADILLRFKLRAHGKHPLTYVKGQVDSYKNRIYMNKAYFDVHDARTYIDISPSKSLISVGVNDVFFQNIFKADAKLDIYPREKKIEGIAYPSIIHITTTPSKKATSISYKKDDSDILYITQKDMKELPFVVDFSQDGLTGVFFDKLGLSLEFGKIFRLYSSDIHPLAKYSPILNLIAVSQGGMELKSKDYENFDIQAKIDDLKYPIYNKDGSLVNNLVLNAKVSKKATYIANLDKSIIIKVNGSHIDVGLIDYNINLNQLLVSKIPILNTMQSQKEVVKKVKKTIVVKKKRIRNEGYTFLQEKGAKEKRLDAVVTEEHKEVVDATEVKNTYSITTNVLAQNVGIFYKDYYVPTNNAEMNIKNNKIELNASYISGMANIIYKDGVVYVNADNFTSNFINAVTKTSYLTGGRFGLQGIYKNEVFRGKAKMSNTQVANLKTLSQILEFIDAVPSLVMFKAPKMGNYKISRGEIDFGYNGKYLGLEKIKVVGNSMDIDGFGIVNMDTDEMDMTLKLTTLKEFSKIMKNIPLLGYLILGKDGKVSTNLTLKGTLGKPKIKLSILKDVLTAPFRMIKRIFTSKEDDTLEEKRAKKEAQRIK